MSPQRGNLEKPFIPGLCFFFIFYVPGLVLIVCIYSCTRALRYGNSWRFQGFKTSKKKLLLLLSRAKDLMTSVTLRDVCLERCFLVKQRAVVWWRNRTVQNYTCRAKLQKPRDVLAGASKISVIGSDKVKSQPGRAPIVASPVAGWEMCLQEKRGTGPLLLG